MAKNINKIKLELPKYKVISRMDLEEETMGYFLQEPKAKEVKFYDLLTIVSCLKRQIFEIDGVKLTKLDKLRGYDGFQLSKVEVKKVENLNITYLGLADVLKYIAKQMGISDKEIITKKLIGPEAECELKTRVTDYYNMSITAATEDLNSKLEFYKENLPDVLKGRVDDIRGTVGDKGYILITVIKKVVK